MSDCCSPRGYRQIFSEKAAYARAKRYRRRGLDVTSRRLVELLLKQRGPQGRTMFEIGAGVGAIQIELLKAGLARAVSIELTPTYEGAAAALLRDAGFEDRVERRVMDVAEAGADLPAADIVVMHRVVCCYPDMPRLVTAAADRTRELLVLSFPKRTWWTRLGLALANMLLRVGRRQFRIFLHSPERILEAAERLGLRTVLDQRGFYWQIAVLERPAR